MNTIEVEFRNVPGTEAALGWAGAHTLVADRPAGRAGGRGLGFTGGELLALAIGGCLCNDLRYVAHEAGMAVDEIGVRVALDIAGRPPVVARARVEVRCVCPGGDAAALIEEVRRTSTVANSVAKGFPVEVMAG